MKKIFEEYGGGIIIALVTAALVGIIGLMYTGNGDGWLEISFQKQGLTQTQEPLQQADGEIVTVYSPTFIDNNQYLFSVGATKPEYVVAAFNMEFSEVYILSNGLASDGKMTNFDASNSPMTLNAETIKSAVIENGVKHIGNNAFYGCNNLESITISNSVESINDRAFSGCSALNTVYGSSGSYAETYAQENGLTFVSVELQ